MTTQATRNIKTAVLELDNDLELFHLADERHYRQEQVKLWARPDRTYHGIFPIFFSSDLAYFSLRRHGDPYALLGFLGPDLCSIEYFPDHVSLPRAKQAGDGTEETDENMADTYQRSRPPEWLQEAKNSVHAILAVRHLLHGTWSQDQVIEDGVHRLDDGTVIHVKDGVLDNDSGPAIKRPDGSRVYYRKGLKSRLKGAAVIAADGSRAYLVDGLLHRCTGAAVEAASGHREFWREGRLDRKNRPAVIYPDGTVKYAENGVVGRKRAPTIIRSDGTRKYLRHGRLHNTSGPAISQGLVRREWWRDGRNLEDDSCSIHCGIDKFDMRLFNQQLQDTLFVKEVFPGSALWTLARRRIAATAASER